MISNAKKAVLHVAKAKLHLEDDQYRDLLRAEGGQASASDLDDAGFDRVMKRFERLGFTSTAKQQRRARRQPRPGGTITEDQQRMIAGLYDELARLSTEAGNPGFATMAARMGFNRRQCRKAFPQTISDGIKVIEGQKRYIARLRSAAMNVGGLGVDGLAEDHAAEPLRLHERAVRELQQLDHTCVVPSDAVLHVP